MRTIVVIPSYEPEERLIKLTAQLVAKDLDVIVVDDGSGEKYLPIFDQLAGARVLRHAENQGKGAPSRLPTNLSRKTTQIKT